MELCRKHGTINCLGDYANFFHSLFWAIALGTCVTGLLPDGPGLVKGIVGLAVVNMALWLIGLLRGAVMYREGSDGWTSSESRRGPGMSQV